MKHKLPDLPYPYDALAPHISAETLEFHHDKHHAAYVNKLNGLIEGTKFADMPLEQIVKTADGGIFNNAAQAWNHDFYWHCMSPDGGGKPAGSLAEAIQKQFGSFDKLKEEFTQAATSHFGSGWIWLSLGAEGKLEIRNAGNAGTPLTEEKTPLLTCDVWEHAYYIDYRNAKPKYVDAFWNLVNWDFVAGRFKS
jgi:Fe-Mn family superoxide dismutase